jgi:hypothetical protein
LVIAKPDYVRRRGPPVQRSEDGGTIYDLSRKQDLYDTFVEVIDVEANRLLLSERIEQYITGFIDEGHFHGFWTNDQGVPFIDVIRFRILEPSRRDP